MSTLQNITHPTSRLRSGRVFALLATGLVLVAAAVAIIAIATGDNGKSTPPAPRAAVSAPSAASGPSQGLQQLVRAHIRHEQR